MKILKLVPGGQGLGETPDGKKVFFWNVLPGEEIAEWEVLKRKKNYDEALPRMMAKYSERRVEPRDECFLSTSPWQVFDYEFELEQKRLLVEESLKQEHLNGFEVEEVRTDGKEWGYRNKMEYALYYDNETQKIHLAFHARGSHRKMPITSSSIEKPEILAEAMRIVDDLNSHGEEARKYQSLLLRADASGKVSGGLFENRKPHPVFPTLSDTILGQKYNYSPNGFFQINLPVYEMALKEIAREIETEKVLDLYAGVGTIGLSVARGRKLTLVECDKSAYQELEKNVNEARSENATVASVRTEKAILAKSEEALEYIEPEMTVIVDPPRAGCDKKLIEKFLEVLPVKIIYLSCNPSTQARDMKLLSEKYEISRVVPFNFFPKTPHIENLIILKRK